ncbi:LysR family transcriptional regulator [Paracoccus pacificus]|uniref:LysR family transcriptional regulator n=1 Tax=Paracoccus pacificus TaxID=1463598 RepID=A0ABW4R6I8_9RHOB
MTGDSMDDVLKRRIKMRQLGLIVAVADTGQIGAAASAINMTQPAASRMLAELERNVGAELTRRHPRGVHLTEAGMRLAERARTILRDLDLASREVLDIDRGRAGRISFGSVAGPSLDLVLPLLQNLRILHPEILTDIVVESSDRLLEHLQSGRIEFYIGRIPTRAEAAMYQMEPIGEEALSMIVREGHELHRHTPRDLSECLRFDWVMQPLGGLLRTTVEQYLATRGFGQPARIIGTSSLMLTLAFVARTNAIGVMSTAAAQFFAAPQSLGARIARLPLADDLKVGTYGLIRLRDRVLTPAGATLYRTMQEAVRVMHQVR